MSFQPRLQRTLFKSRTLNEYTNSLTSYLPAGRAFDSKDAPDSNLFKIMQGFSGQVKVFGDLTNFLTLDYFPPSCVSLLPEWERAMGIPDDCFDTDVDVDLRRRQILVKIALVGGIVTADDWVRLAALLNIPIRVFPGISQPPLTEFDIIIEAPLRFEPFVFPHSYTFPVRFSTVSGNIVTCLFNKIKPAHTQIQFRWVGTLP